MKKFLIGLGVLIVLIMLQSCNGAHKVCAAYAKHDTGTDLIYSEVQ